MPKRRTPAKDRSPVVAEQLGPAGPTPGQDWRQVRREKDAAAKAAKATAQAYAAAWSLLRVIKHLHIWSSRGGSSCGCLICRKARGLISALHAAGIVEPMTTTEELTEETVVMVPPGKRTTGKKG